MGKIVRLTEGQLRQVIENTINKNYINESNIDTIKQKIFANADKIKSTLAKVGITKFHIDKLKSMLNKMEISTEDSIKEEIWNSNKLVFGGAAVGLLSIAVLILTAIAGMIFPDNSELLGQIIRLSLGGVASGIIIEILGFVISIFEDEF